MKGKTEKSRSGGFTLMELLVVISIIFLLVGILVPGMQKVKNMAWDMKQKSIFHATEVALEFFAKDFENYPDSSLLGTPPNVICGAQRLAEAIVGRDLNGFDPETTWNPAAEKAAGGIIKKGQYIEDVTAQDIYASTEKGSNADQVKLSKFRRKGPYFDMRDVGFFTMEELYGAGSTGNVYPSQDGYLSPVMTDVFRQTKVNKNDGIVDAGSPVLYYKADRRKTEYMEEDASGNVQWANYYTWIYNYNDNAPITDLPSIKNQEMHHYDINYDVDTADGVQDGIRLFYETAQNPKVEKYNKPYNANTFLLISAGRDGLYGTRDDITNFDY